MKNQKKTILSKSDDTKPNLMQSESISFTFIPRPLQAMGLWQRKRVMPAGRTAN